MTWRLPILLFPRKQPLELSVPPLFLARFLFLFIRCPSVRRLLFPADNGKARNVLTERNPADNDDGRGGISISEGRRAAWISPVFYFEQLEWGRNRD